MDIECSRANALYRPIVCLHNSVMNASEISLLHNPKKYKVTIGNGVTPLQVSCRNLNDRTQSRG